YGFKRLDVEFLHVDRRWLEDELELGVLEEAVGVLAVAAVGGTARGLRVADFVRLGAKHAEKGFRRHGAGADFDVVRLLQNAAALRPETLQTEEQVLEGERGLGRCGLGGRHAGSLSVGTLANFISQMR